MPTFISLGLAVLLFSGTALADSFDDAIAKFRAADGTQTFFSQAYGYAVFPTVGKGGIGIGGAYGKGRVYEAGAYTGDTSMAQLTIGFQLGGQAYSQIVFFQDKAAHDKFTSGNFEFGAEASAVAITLGAQAKAGTTGASAGGNEAISGEAAAATGWTVGMAIFTLAKGGLMYEASIGGQKFNYKRVSS
ncbi:MAG: YSC84-related protein [Gammaproteobacteria bacterium]